MDSVVNSLMMVCAVLAALAAGVLLGYMALKALFTLCRVHARSIGGRLESVSEKAVGSGAVS